MVHIAVGHCCSQVLFFLSDSIRYEYMPTVFAHDVDSVYIGIADEFCSTSFAGYLIS